METPLAMCKLGNAFDDFGIAGVNYAEAMRYYRMSAEAGHTDAMYNLAGMYYKKAKECQSTCQRQQSGTNVQQN